MIKSKPAALPLYYVSTHSLMAVVALTVEVTLPATPPAVSSGKSATLSIDLHWASWHICLKVLQTRRQWKFKRIIVQMDRQAMRTTMFSGLSS